MDKYQNSSLISKIAIFLMKCSRRKLLLFCFSSIILIVYLSLSKTSSVPKSFIILRKTHSNNISCHYIKAGDALPAAESVLLNSKDESIFFHETSCRGGLNLRQACSIESAARAHPTWVINVLFSGPISQIILDRTCIAKLREFENIRFARVHINEYAKDTPLEILVNNGSLEQSSWRVEHTSDVLRYLTLYKWGGIYLDLDMIVVKPFHDLRGNWVGKQSDGYVNAAAIGLSKDAVGRKFANKIIEELRTTFDPNVWITNGPGVITRVLEKNCLSRNISTWSEETCGFPVYEPQYFYPVSYQDKNLYFGEEKLEHVEKAYTHHMWNKLSEDESITAESVYAKLAKTYCPTIYNSFGNDFRM